MTFSRCIDVLRWAFLKSCATCQTIRTAWWFRKYQGGVSTTEHQVKQAWPVYNSIQSDYKQAVVDVYMNIRSVIAKKNTLKTMTQLAVGKKKLLIGKSRSKQKSINKQPGNVQWNE